MFRLQLTSYKEELCIKIEKNAQIKKKLLGFFLYCYFTNFINYHMSKCKADLMVICWSQSLLNPELQIVKPLVLTHQSYQRKMPRSSSSKIHHKHWKFYILGLSVVLFYFYGHLTFDSHFLSWHLTT